MMLTSKQKRAWAVLKYGYDPSVVVKTNDDVLRAIKISQRLNKTIEPLANYIFELAHEYSEHPNYHGYTFKADMASYATLLSLNSILKFDATKSNNPKAYLVICFRSAFVNYISKERKQWEIKEELTARIANGQVD